MNNQIVSAAQTTNLTERFASLRRPSGEVQTSEPREQFQRRGSAGDIIKGAFRGAAATFVPAILGDAFRGYGVVLGTAVDTIAAPIVFPKSEGYIPQAVMVGGAVTGLVSGLAGLAGPGGVAVITAVGAVCGAVGAAT